MAGIIARLKDKKAVALIIVIFALMVFAILGWTLAVMQSTDFEANLRSLDSERALGEAETGARWALRQLSSNFSCNAIPVGTAYTLGDGKYACPTSLDCNDSSPPDIYVNYTGCVPAGCDPVTPANYRALRKVRVKATQGSFSNVGTIKNLLTWYAMHPGSSIDGKIIAGHYDGDNVSPFDVVGADYGPNLPPGNISRTQDNNVKLPKIDLNYFYSQTTASQRFDYSTTATASGSSGTTLKTNTALFDNSMVGQAVRVVGGTWPAEDQWVAITGYSSSTQVSVALKPSIGLNDINAWNNRTVRVARRFYSNYNNKGLYYVKGGDIIIDVRTTDGGPGTQAQFQKTSLVAEGDILISGTKGVSMQAFINNATKETFPNLSTKDGNIYSTFQPEGSTESQRAGNRGFDGLIYTQNGNISFNYIDGVSLMGYNVTLDGLIKLEYEDKYVSPNGFIGNISKTTWQEIR